VEKLFDAAVADETAQLEYVYLLRVEILQPQKSVPNVKIPTVLLPAAEPAYEGTVAAPPAETEQFE
jgi:hypothetical protein